MRHLTACVLLACLLLALVVQGHPFNPVVVMNPTREHDPLTFTRCMNGGALVDGSCVCPIYYTGDNCEQRQCPHSLTGSGEKSIAPLNPSTQMCDRCDEDTFKGMNCQLCQSDRACELYGGRKGTTCQTGMAAMGSSKNYQCKLDSPFFINAMGDGRNITAEILLNCHTGAQNESFGKGYKGMCEMTIYRVEPNNEYLDPFLRCAAEECTMSYSDIEKEDKQEEVASFRQRAFTVVKRIGRIVLVGLCVLLVLLGRLSRSLGPRRMRTITLVLSFLLVFSVLVYIALMVVSMQSVAVQRAVNYKCEKSMCNCSADPPAKYQPLCSESVILGQILPSVQNGITIQCNDVTGRCKLTMVDISLVFDANCTGSECYDPSAYDSESDNNSPAGDSTRNLVLMACSLVFLLTCGGIVAHWLFLRQKSKGRAKEFRQIFYGADGPHHGGEVQAADATERRSVVRRDSYLSSSEEDVHDEGESIGIGATPTSAAGEANDVLSAVTLERAQQVRALTRATLELTITDLRYKLKPMFFSALTERAHEVILHQVNFSIRSGDVLAIMGPSGAGKTTLLDILSARAKSGSVSGTIYINGTPLNASRLTQYRNIIGYVSQEDTLLPALTVRQTITYAARLKLPSAFSRKTIRRIVSHMIYSLKLQRCENTLIGDGDNLRGISGGEKRRVSIAVELLANPRILFLDEPTSGLDATSAIRVIEAVVRMAKESPMRRYAPHFFAFEPIVIFSIHQPSQEIYNYFDKILLLSQGMSVYCGPANAAAATMETRVNNAFRRTQQIPRKEDHHNVAEYLMKLEAILDDSVRMELQNESMRESMSAITARQTYGFTAASSAPPPNENVVEVPEVVSGEDILKTTASLRIYYVNVYQQVRLLTSRAIASLIGSFHLIVCHAAVVAALAVLMCYLYNGQALDLPGALNRAGSVTFLLLVTSFVALSSLELLLAERKLLVVERENGFYSTFPYLVSKIIVDIIPLRVLPAAVLSSIIYFPMGFRTDAGAHFLWFLLVITLFSICITLMVLCIGVLTGTFGAAALISSVFILWNFVFGGSMVQAETIPSVLRPFKSFSPFFLAFESLMVNELNGQACVFSPTDETGKPSSASIPILCVQYIANIGLKPQRFYTDIIQLALYCFGFTLLAWFLLVTCTRIVR